MATTKAMTAADLIAMPDDGHRYELIEGMLHRMAPAGMEHGEVGMEFAIHLGAFAREHDLGRVYGPDTGFLLSRDPETVVAPDVAFVRGDRLPPRSRRKGFSEVVPDLAVEVVSPFDSQPEVAAKVARYLAAGARLVWVAYPRTRTVAVHAPGRPVRVLGEGDILDGDVLPGFRLAVVDVFR